MATALHKIICCWWAWARTFTPELGIVGLDSTGSSGITQVLANQKSPGLFSLSLRWTADWNLPALTWNWKGFVPENYLNGAHPTGNPHWDFPCEIWHFNRLTSLKTSLASQHGLALSLEFELPASQLTAPLLTTAVPSPALAPKDPRAAQQPQTQSFQSSSVLEASPAYCPAVAERHITQGVDMSWRRSGSNEVAVVWSRTQKSNSPDPHLIYSTWL